MNVIISSHIAKSKSRDSNHHSNSTSSSRSPTAKDILHEHLPKWIPSSENRIPIRGLVGGHDNDSQPLYVCRSYMFGGVHCGKAGLLMQPPGAHIPYAGKQNLVNDYEVLVIPDGSQMFYTWIPVMNGVAGLEEIRVQGRFLPVIGGYEKDGRIFYIAQTVHDEGTRRSTHPGKVGSHTPDHIQAIRNMVAQRTLVTLVGRQHLRVASATMHLINPTRMVVQQPLFMLTNSYTLGRILPSSSGRQMSTSRKNEDETPHPTHKLHEVHPVPVRSEFISYSLNSKQLEDLDIGIGSHRKMVTVGDYVAWGAVRTLRPLSDLFFRNKYVHRAVTLETVAAVPGFVAGMWRHLTSLRKMKHDGGWISHLLHEADNERMHLMIWMKVCQPSFTERMLVGVTQYAFTAIFSILYILWPSCAHRFTGYLEEEAVISYTHFLKAIDNGDIPNTPAPDIALDYYNLPRDARIRDVVLAVRADEANHRDVNHTFADRILAHNEDLRKPYTPRKVATITNKAIGDLDVKNIDVTVHPHPAK
ncbi:hypothetical protein SmJEL517_g00346 [Synchytrium microbalum]|uniref:Alternative oxidase n=1 Tax=Synchytrium microbalum TaxID=1806994 RepID=A0A507CGK6_9FUNG|nr:uncharacterized protein SmJEL517_g00346 [Synchytrium microbalum]TPX38359.1 hypothetical protein SmJEL517_g00346 [Synchytrium microbalum]